MPLFGGLLQISFFFVGETLRFTGDAYFTGDAFLGLALISVFSTLTGDFSALITLERIGASFAGSGSLAGFTSSTLISFWSTFSFFSSCSF